MYSNKNFIYLHWYCFSSFPSNSWIWYREPITTIPSKQVKSKLNRFIKMYFASMVNMLCYCCVYTLDVLRVLCNLIHIWYWYIRDVTTIPKNLLVRKQRVLLHVHKKIKVIALMSTAGAVTAGVTFF